MFRLTFLGHQGWMVEGAEGGRLLIDPLLVEEFAHGGVVGRVWPPRELEIDRIPPIDALLLTHEHEDHFNIPSLNRLDRRIPVFLPARSSGAARAILDEMGFRVTLTVPDTTYSIADLTLHTFTADHTQPGHSDEYDVLPFLIHDRGHGNFFTAVDVMPPPSLLARLKKIVARPGIWGFTNNATDFDFMTTGKILTPPVDSGALAGHLAAQHAALVFEWEAPAAWVVCGGGFAFDERRPALNHRVFPVDNFVVTRATSLLYPQQSFVVPTPGQSVVLRDGALVGVEDVCPFLRTLPRSQWPDRTYQPTREFITEYEPACGEPTFSPDDLDELMTELSGWAQYLHSSMLFKQLYSLGEDVLHGRRPTFALMLLASPERESFTLAYDPATCSFIECDSDDPVADYLAAAECWANDLLRVLRGDLGPTAIVFGRMRLWNQEPEKFPFGVEGTIWTYTHPLNRPDRFLNLYRKLLASEPADPPRAAARTSAR